MMKRETVLITGASRGIGAAAARLFASKGLRVAINCSASMDRAQSLADELRAQGADAAAFCADVADRKAVEGMFTRIAEQLGPVDILVNNAGIAQQKLFQDISEADWDRMFEVNVKGVYHCVQAALPHMIHQKNGYIVNLSSIWGICGASCEAHYSAAKAAVIGLSKALAKELGPSGIRVNCVAPGVVDTQMNGILDAAALEALKEETPLGMLGKPQDIAQLIVYLCSDAAGFITGQVLSPNGGIVI
ncbi:elongation factor P 5-aminopentanone reductase [Candidatus Soleaferrea massiliensis]|uniref:elongation factor P 5-aminopentanone reductase n=1 Tax=Candidatus Soleaferrea massiliensis TaxID=1470354 RepID=UPI00058EE678|nr:3-oxoacyl-ACP reductase FabG [Candidatus Soleaferrea massiliensis]